MTKAILKISDVDANGKVEITYNLGKSKFETPAQRVMKEAIAVIQKLAPAFSESPTPAPAHDAV